MEIMAKIFRVLISSLMVPIRGNHATSTDALLLLQDAFRPTSPHSSELRKTTIRRAKSYGFYKIRACFALFGPKRD